MTEDQVFRIVMVEDQASYAEAFEITLSLADDLDLAGRAATITDGLQLCALHHPDLVVTDYRLRGGETGTQFAQQLRDQGFTKPIVFLTGYAAAQVARETAPIANVHLLSKDDAMADILAGLRSAALGESPDRDFATGLMQDLPLSQGELHVLELLAAGHTPAAIASELFLSLHTIRSRVKSIHRKLGVHSQGEAIAMAIRSGLVVPPT